MLFEISNSQFTMQLRLSTLDDIRRPIVNQNIIEHIWNEFQSDE